MRIISLCIFLLVAASVALSADRPKITGIDHVDFYTTSPDSNTQLYVTVLGLNSVLPAEPGQTARFMVGKQWVGYSPAPDPSAMNRMDHAAFATDDATALQAYLKSKGIQTTDLSNNAGNGGRSFRVKDPEGQTIEFIERAKNSSRIKVQASNAISRHMIHVGFVVHDRAAEDHFYRDILGFRPYWHGGMTADRDDWVAMQVPDGTDWLEYMLNIKPDADQRTMGVMDHISLGVKDMKEAAAKVNAATAKLAADSKPRMDAQPKIGRDGKWQLNIYDPDQTRVELMEFTPAEKPCCSEFQGQHPKE